MKSLPGLSKLFHDFEEISALQLNIKKTVLVPLWPMSSETNLRQLIIELCPLWRDISIGNSAKYLGFFIGPGAGERSWDKPLQKYTLRFHTWASMHLGLNLNLVAYKPFIASVLAFVMQLEPHPASLCEHFASALRKLAAGPGSWITTRVLCNLRAYHFPAEFADPRWTGMAAKLRVISSIAEDCKLRAQELDLLCLECGRRPFPEWHRRCYFVVLARTQQCLRERGITKEIVRDMISNDSAASFQHTAEILIKKAFDAPYLRESRVRAKLFHWQFSILRGHLERKVNSRLILLSRQCRPRVLAAYFK